VVEKLDFTRHPIGFRVQAVVIKRDGEEQWADQAGQSSDWHWLDPTQLRDKIAGGGIVGMGGATFPTMVKLSPPPDKTIDTIIVNGVECEPFLTSDHRLMLEKPEAIVEGLEIILKTTGAMRGIVAIEANKPDAAQVMRQATAGLDGVSVQVLPVKYPQGAEKQLIYAITGREVPAGGLPMDVGVVVQNVGTAAAIADAVIRSVPLIERVLTVAGDGVENPGNFLVRIGTPLRSVIERCGPTGEAGKVILGGPMMGLAQGSIDEISVNKGTSGVLVLRDADASGWRQCIRCGRCVRSCPMGLAPSVLSVLCEQLRFDEAADAGLMNCIECGVCAYVCPSKRPMVSQYKLGKAEVASKQKREKIEKEAKTAADAAKEKQEEKTS